MRNFQDNTFEHKHMERFFKPALTLWARRATGSGTGGCRGCSLLPCTHVGRACKKTPSFEEDWMGVLKILVSTLNSPELLRYNRLKLRFLFFFLMSIFQCIPGLNGLSQSIALVQKWKKAVFLKFLLISKWNRQKRANSNLLPAHH